MFHHPRRYTSYMYKPCFSLLLAAFILLLGCATPQTAQAQTLTDEQVGEAIQKIKDYLYATQDPATGGWYGSYHAGPQENPDDKNAWGPTAMAVLALISSGESPQKPELAKALKLLGEAQFNGVYALSMRTHVWSYLPKEFEGALVKDARTMIQSSYGLSKFDYYVYGAENFKENNSRTDNSTTQYGILALWQASKRGIDVPQGFWVDAVENFLKMQSDVDGGWAYSGNRGTSQSMTLAGLTCMYVAQQELFRDQDKPNAKVKESIEKGIEYLNKNFKVADGVHGGASYMWYGYERVGLASGMKYFGGKDWYQEIAQQIVKKNAKFGNQIHTASFDLMFLARGRVPVWINKLQIPGADWNNRPNDVYFLNRFISEYREHEVNWQVVSTDSNPEEWISAPLMWVSSDGQIDWTDDQVAKIKKYIDLGGTVIANPEGGSSSFRSSIQDLAERMYPDLKFSSIERDHPMASLLVGSARGNKKPDFRVLSNGARVLMVLPKDDWGKKFQADKKPDPEKSPEWRHIINIFGVATDRGELTPRLSSPMVKKQQRATTGTIKVVIPQWEDPAGAMPETDIYQVMRNYMHNETGNKLIVEQIPFAQLAEANPSLLHLVGVNAVEVKPAEREAIQAYISSGGTVLVETLGGTGDFARSIREQLGVIFPGDEGKVSPRTPIITSIGLPDGAKRNRRPIYRRMVLERSDPKGKLLMNGYEKNDRYPVLLTYEDLSLGMLGVKQYGISGYSVETSRNLMLNILLEAKRAHPGSEQPVAPAEPVDAAANAGD